MKSFKQYITEAKRDLPKGNPGGMTPGDIEAFRNATPGERPPLSTDDKRTNRRTRSRIFRTGRSVRKRSSAIPVDTASTPKPSGKPIDPSDVAAARQSGRIRTGTNTPLSDLPQADTAKITPQKKAEVDKFVSSRRTRSRIGQGESQRAAALNQAMTDGADKPSTSSRSDGRNLLDRLTGRTSRRATRISGAATGQAAKPTGSLRSGNLSFPGDRSGAYAAAKAQIKDTPAPAKPASTAKSVPAKPASTAKSVPAKPAPVKQSEVSKAIKQSLINAKSTREAKPTATQLKQFRLGQTKGYIGKTGTPTPQGIQTYTTRRATKGFGDAGYDPAKRGVKDPLAAKRNVDNIVSRAAAGDKAARKEVKRSYKAMTRRYKDIVPSGQRTKAGLESVRRGLENAYNAPSANRPTTLTPPKPPSTSSGGGGASTGRSGGGSGGGTAVMAPPKTAVMAPPKAPPTKTPRKINKKITTNTSGKLSDTIAPRLVSNARKRMKSGVKSPTPPKQSSLKLSPARKTASLKAATSSASALKSATSSASTANAPVTQKSVQKMVKSALGTAGRGVARAAGGAATGLDAFLNYRKNRVAGDSRLKAGLKAGFRTAAGWLGGAVGSSLGSLAGPVGTIGGGVAGYTAGTSLADKVLSRLRKKPKKK